jgi:hypothetical protein
METKENVKVKLQLVAFENIDDNGKAKKVEKVNDALQAVDLDGHKIAVKNFGKQLSNILFTTPTPPEINDIIEYRREIEKLHDNGGKEFEVSENMIPIMKEAIKKGWNTFFIDEAAGELLDKALAKAKMTK